MKYKDSSFFQHGQEAKVGLLITNLGTPESPTPSALRRYLKQFLWDPRVVEFPRWLWWLVLNCIILRIRPRRSAAAYKKVWTDRGSPLAFHTHDQAAALAAQLKIKWGDRLIVDWAMRYGEPSIETRAQAMFEQGVRKLLVLPLYPQYSASTTGSTFDALSHDFTRRRWMPEFRFVSCYHDFPPYIEALAKTVERYWELQGRAQLLMMSYHGVPQRYLHKGDPYHCQCHVTSRLLAQRLGLNENEYMTSFQSRFGREPWLQPYTDETLKGLPDKGVKTIQVLCPGFSSDCLETIEEIGMENREYFMEAGGERFDYIPALNAQKVHIDALGQLAEKHLSGWFEEAHTAPAVSKKLYESHSHNKPKA